VQSTQLSAQAFPDLEMGTHDLPAGGRVEVGTHRLRPACALTIEVDRAGIDDPVGGVILDGVTRRHVSNLRVGKSAVQVYGALAAGPYLLTLSHPDVVAVCAPFTLRADSVTKVQVRLQRAAQLHLAFDGLPGGVEDVLVEVFEAAASGRRVAASRRYPYNDGAAWRFALPPGRYRVRATVAGEVFAERELSMANTAQHVVLARR
jgi:hypothetical protein